MARQTYYLAKDVRHPLYKTRMLQAGPLELDASAARLYRNLGVELSDEAPKRAPDVQTTMVAHEPRVTSAPKAEAPKKAAPKRRRKK